MKKLSLLLAGILVCASVISQTVTIRFEGTGNANSNNPKDYAIDLDGKWYTSSGSAAGGSAGMKQIVLDNLAIGSHKIMVYDVKDNSAAANSSSNELLYSNNFQLRSGYDMVIAVRRNGNVTFTEKKSKLDGSGSSAQNQMADAEFTKLGASIKAKWSQSSRVSALRTAFANKNYYFTTDQVGQLLMLVTSESSRLELAKLSYPRVTDPTHFADVADLFTVQSNKDNFLTFYQSKNPDVVVGSNGVRQPLTTQQFNQLLRKTRNQYDQTAKYAVLRDAFSMTTTYYTTAQLRQLLTLITAEADRLALAKLSYPQVSDEANFASLSTMFTTQSNRDEFNNYVRYGGSLGSTGQYASRIAMSESNFSKLHTKARLHFRQSSTVADIKAALSNTSNYFTVDQIRSLLTLVSLEADRLALAKLAYHRSADPTSFTQLMDLFTTQASVDDLNTYVRNNPS